jgi:hypothetical protein
LKHFVDDDYFVTQDELDVNFTTKSDREIKNSEKQKVKHPNSTQCRVKNFLAMNKSVSLEVNEVYDSEIIIEEYEMRENENILKP